VIVFAEKISATSAQRGYFVAKSYTKDAVAQAQKDPRITLLTATEQDPATTIVPDSFHITSPASVKPLTTFRVAGTEGKNPTPIDVQGKTVILYGEARVLRDVLVEWGESVYAEQLLHMRTWDLGDGIHPMTAAAERTFGPGECVIDGQEMDYVRIDLECGVQITHPAVISHYEVASRGRVIRLAPVTVRDVSIYTVAVTPTAHW
jgi:hypothetical protein